jgi:hypothetical protein
MNWQQALDDFVNVRTITLDSRGQSTYGPRYLVPIVGGGTAVQRWTGRN